MRNHVFLYRVGSIVVLLALLRVSVTAQTILREYFLDIPGANVSQLTTAPSYPDDPDGFTFEPLFEAPPNFGDSFGTRMRGYVVAPMDGDYTFWIASDDQSELWLSTDENPANVQRIASVVNWVGSRVWEEPRDGNAAAQRSAPRPLLQGERYYIEARHKEGDQGDNLAVGWQLPNGTFERPIPGNRLNPWLISTDPPGITVEPGDVSLEVGQDAQFSMAATGAQPLQYQWHRDGVPLPFQQTPTLLLTQVELAANGALFHCVVSNMFGVALTRQALLSVSPDNTPPVVGSRFPEAGFTVRRLGQVEVTFSEPVEGVDAADLMVGGQAASRVSGVLAGPYLFELDPWVETAETLAVEWAAAHGITDRALVPNPFGGGTWQVEVDPLLAVPEVVISEFLASNQEGLADEDGASEDWIEVQNRSDAVVNLAGWSLSDDEANPGQWILPAVSLDPGEFLIVFASGKDRRIPGAELHAGFKLAGSGEHLGLYAPDSPRLLVGGFPGAYPEQKNDHSYGLDPLGALRYFAVPTPGGTNGGSGITGVARPVEFSATRGVYSAPFVLSLSTPTKRGYIQYTVDGSAPTESNGIRYAVPIPISGTTFLRAAAFRSDMLPSSIETHTFFFNLTGMQSGLPVMSVVIRSNDWRGPAGIVGINGGTRSGDGAWISSGAGSYFNPVMHGLDWEKPVSVEYINPGDNSGFHVDAGIRVQGSDWARPRYQPDLDHQLDQKISYRLYFRGDYGDSKLRYRLFPDSAVEEFDHIVLRAGMNDRVDPFVRDELMRQLSDDMGQTAIHGTFVNLFINGEYKGYYNPTERVRSGFMQSHLGGGEEWDVITIQSAAQEGDNLEFNSLRGFANSQDTTDPAVFQQVEARLDVPAFIDYLLVNGYGAMGDWPHNNWRAGRERAPGSRIRFFMWDAEWGLGIYSRPASFNTFTANSTDPNLSGLANSSEISGLYQRLKLSSEFRLMWADHVERHMFNGGALTDAHVLDRFNEMRTQLALAIPGMSQDIATRWVPQRRSIFMSHMAAEGLLAGAATPVFSQHGGSVARGYPLTITGSPGTIYYTTTGVDPRVRFSGDPAGDAQIHQPGTPVTLNSSVTVKARIRNGPAWSALAEAGFEVASLELPVRITEIMYNPPGGSPYEYIELLNAGGSVYDLSGLSLDGVEYLFSIGTLLAPGDTLLLASDEDPAAFAQRYPGVMVGGYFGGGLVNSGERLALIGADGAILLSVDYRDDDGWPAEADGGGYSIEIVDPFGDPDGPSNWRASVVAGGSPGAISPSEPLVGEVRINEIQAENVSAVENDGTYPDWVELQNAGGEPVDLSGWSLTDDEDRRKFVLPPGTVLGAGGFLVVWCDSVTNTTPGLHAGFALNRDGDSVLLYDDTTNLADIVTIGLQVADLSVGRVGGGWQLTLPTPGMANVAAGQGSQAGLAINEWLADPPAGQEDWIELFNNGASPVALQGMYIGTASRVSRVLSLSFIGAGSYLQLLADELPGSGHLDFKLPAAGGEIVLYDDAAVEIDRVSYGIQAEGVSRGRIPNGTGPIFSFPFPTPGASNHVVSYTGARLNEVMAWNRSVPVDPSGQFFDWCELYNPGPGPFNLSGMSLSVGERAPGQWVFPVGTLVPVGGYLIVGCDPSRPASLVLEANLNLGRSLEGEAGAVFLFNGIGQLVDSVEYGFQVVDRSIGLTAGQWRLQAAATPGGANGAAAALVDPSGLRINEWLAQSPNGGDWFEVYNSSAAPVSLAGIYLTDDPSTFGRTKYKVAPLSFIDAGGWVVWQADSGVGANHVNFELAGSGETLRIYSGGLTLIDSVAFSAGEVAVSTGRLPDGGAALVPFPVTPTPGEANHVPLDGLVINEILARSGVPLEDAIEVFNGGGQSVDLGGWYLSDSRDAYKKHLIPGGTVVVPGGFRVFYQAQFGFGLDGAAGGEIFLSQADGGGNLTGVRALGAFGPQAVNVSFGRHATVSGVDYVAMHSPTFGEDSAATVEEFRRGTGRVNSGPRVGPAVINEIHYHPPEPEDPNREYIEILNVGGGPLNLFNAGGGWNLWGAVEFTFDGSTVLGAGEALLVVGFDPVAFPAILSEFRAAYGVPGAVQVAGPFAGRLNNSGETVRLGSPDESGPSWILIDAAGYSDTVPWPEGLVDGGGHSLQRRAPDGYGGDVENWGAGAPTAGAPNVLPVLPPMILSSPASRIALSGSDEPLTVQAGGSGPFQFQWRRNGVPLSGATNGTHVITDVAPTDEGEYDAFVSNPGGTRLSASAQIRVADPPAVLQVSPDTAVDPGDDVTLSVLASGSAPLQYQWRRNGVPIAGADGAGLTLLNVQLEDAGVYTVYVANEFASTVSPPVTLKVLVRPSFAVIPMAQAVPIGGTLVLSVKSIGTLPMGYRWRRGGVTVKNEVLNSDTSILVIPNFQSTHAGSYTVILTNEVFYQPGVPSTPAASVTVAADTDMDGLPDQWETDHGLDLNDPADAGLDLDGDGLTAAQEYIAGTDPEDGESFLRIDSVEAGQGVIIEFMAVGGRTYTVEYNDSPAVGPWLKLLGVPATAATRTERVSDPLPGAHRIYRLVTPAVP